MTAVALRHGKAAVFAGQSLNLVPAAPNDYPTLCVAGTSIARFVGAHDGYTFAQLLPTEPSDVDTYARIAAKTVAVLCEGTSDVWNNVSAADLYALFVAWAARRRAAGFTKCVATTLPGNSTNTGGQETTRQAFNTLLKADASVAFDAIVDLDATALSDWTNTTYYQTGLHWKTAGAQLAGDTVRPTLVSVLA